MKKIISFDDYMLDMLSEAVVGDKLRLIISSNLRILLDSIKDNPIAAKILEEADSDKTEYKVTYIDIDDSNPKKKDMVSFMNSNKVMDYVMKTKGFSRDGLNDKLLKDIKTYSYFKQDQFYKLNNRSTTTIGRIVGKLFPNIYNELEIEKFVNIYKASRDTSDFELVKGSAIQHWYHEDNYMEGAGPLHGSCMKYGECTPYLQFYVDNQDKVSLLILKAPNDPEKIRGRALVWELDIPSGRTYMDRIYTINDSDVVLFKEYAKEHKWLYKVYQNMDEDGPWFDTITGKETSEDLVVFGLNDPGFGGYPYMDTMKFFDGDSISNDASQVSSGAKKLEDTEGGAEESGEWVEYYGEYIPEDELTWCEIGDCYRKDDDYYYSEYYGEHVAEDYADEEMEELDHYDDWGDRYRKQGDYITTYEGNTCDEEYAQNNFEWSEYHGDWLEEAIYSEYHQDAIAEDEAVEVYTDAYQRGTDWRIDDESDGHWFEWDGDDEKYDDDVSEDDLKDANGWVYSDYQGEYLDPDNAVEVYIDVEGDDTDWRDDNQSDGAWWVWDHDNEKYSDDITEDELREYHELDEEDED